MSPELEEGKIAATGRVMFGAELQTVNGTFFNEVKMAILWKLDCLFDLKCNVLITIEMLLPVS